MNNLQRIERLGQYIAEGLITRGAWRDTDDAGRERACLLVALAPEVTGDDGAEACPASVLPAWLAHLTPSLDDNVSLGWWSEFLALYATTLRRVYALTERGIWTDEDWRRQDYLARAVALRVALPVAGTSAGAVERVLALCERAGGGGVVSREEWREAKWAAAAAEAKWAAAAEAKWAAEAEAAAAWAEAEAAAEAAWAAWAEAWDQIAKGVLDNLAARCAELEAK